MVQESQYLTRHGLTATRTKASAKPVTKIQATEAARLLQLIHAAEDIFLAKGYHTATMSDVAKAAGMSKKTVYQLIESKSELFLALLEHHQSKLVFPATQEGWTIREVLVENLLCLGRFILSPQQVAIVRLIMAEYTHSNDFGRLFHQKRVVKVKTRLENCLIELARDRMNMGDPKEMAAMLFGMALGEFHLSVLIGFRPMPTKAALERRIRCAVNVFLSGRETIGV
jgi:TetR/AcrR family transcriptional regulator of autoinduction and epiphytic fitness